MSPLVVCPMASGGMDKIGKCYNCWTKQEKATIVGQNRKMLQLLTVGGDDEAAEDFVVFGTAFREGSMPFL